MVLVYKTINQSINQFISSTTVQDTMRTSIQIQSWTGMTRLIALTVRKLINLSNWKIDEFAHCKCYQPSFKYWECNTSHQPFRCI